MSWYSNFKISTFLSRPANKIQILSNKSIFNISSPAEIMFKIIVRKPNDDYVFQWVQLTKDVYAVNSIISVKDNDTVLSVINTNEYSIDLVEENWMKFVPLEEYNAFVVSDIINKNISIRWHISSKWR